MLDAFFQMAPEAAEAVDALAPYAPSGVLAAIGFMLRGALSPIVDAAKAAKIYFEGLAAHTELEKAHIEAEIKHWRQEERMLSDLVAAHVLSDAPA